MNRILAVLLMVAVIPCCNKQSSNEEASLKNDQPVKRFVSSVAGLNLRENSEMKSKIITTVSFGKEVIVISETGDEIFLEGRYGKWCNISFENKTGWVFSGFLSIFDPSPLRHIIGTFYREQYKKTKKDYKTDVPEMYEYYTTFKDSEIKIKIIIDNYILAAVPNEDYDSIKPDDNYVIWIYNKDTNNFTEAFATEWNTHAQLLYINNDRFPDAIHRSGCCRTGGLSVYLGTGRGFQEHISMACDDFYPPNDEKDSFGRCGDTKFGCTDYENKKRIIYQFNCSTDKLEVIKEIMMDKDWR